MISVIIRSRNEERWIRECLRRIQAQSIQDVEVILVDNGSQDRTVARAEETWPGIQVIQIEDYTPGKAINAGIRAAQGEYIAILSAHCLPVGDDWLATLKTALKDDQVAGVYGRQIPTSYSSALDKRDLLVTFGLDRRVQQKDIFFHNANSMLRRTTWEHYPFDEEVSNIEDRVWGKTAIDAGYVLVYEPDAAVYHYHGIYQNNDEARVQGAVRIMEELERSEEAGQPVDPASLEIAAIIPVRTSAGGVDADERLLRLSIEAAQAAEHIDRVIVASDDKSLAGKVAAWGAEAPFVRPAALSKSGVRSDQVLQYALEQLEDQGYSPDLIVPLEVTYPFRPAGLLDGLIERLLNFGLDTAIAAFAEQRPYWSLHSEGLVLNAEYQQARSEREPLHVGLLSLGCVTYAEFVRQGSRLGKRIGIYEIDDPFAAIEIRSADDLALLDLLADVVPAWRAKRGEA